MKTSAGLILYRRKDNVLEVLLVHPGGPIWTKRDSGAWSIPKGEVSEGEDLFVAARREFGEELGTPPPGGATMPLGSITQKGGKIVHAWGVEGEFDTTTLKSNTFTMVWPPNSGQQHEFPEVDKATFFPLDTAKQMINAAQIPLLERLQGLLK